MTVADSSDETNTERLSFRTTRGNAAKLIEVARAKGFINSRGRPNISAVLNYIIERFDLAQAEKDDKSRRKRG